MCGSLFLFASPDIDVLGRQLPEQLHCAAWRSTPVLWTTLEAVAAWVFLFLCFGCGRCGSGTRAGPCDWQRPRAQVNGAVRCLVGKSRSCSSALRWYSSRFAGPWVGLSLAPHVRCHLEWWCRLFLLIVNQAVVIPLFSFVAPPLHPDIRNA